MQDSRGLGLPRSENVSFSFIALAMLVVVSLCTIGTAQTNPQATQKQFSASTPSGAQFVGSDTCRGCHEEVYTKNFEGTPHFSLTKSGKHGCEDCHGPGSAHVEGGGDTTKIISFKALSSEGANKICLKCHSASSEQANFMRSTHASSDVGCTTCHSPHHSKIQRSLLRDNQPQLCFGCHAIQSAEFSRPYRHRVKEGLIQCSDCHNVHGSQLMRQVRTTPTQDQICVRCHTDTRGPFVYEHLPVKTEGCVSCHTPHGSTNPRLLRVSQINVLCLQCHTLALSSVPSAPPVGPPHNQAGKYQACTMCHAFIHGSNFSEVFFKP